MKRIVIAILVVMIGASADVQAQSNRKKTKAIEQKTVNAKSTKTAAAKANSTDTVSMVSTSTNQAYGATRFSIADPIVNIFNQRANNAPATFNGKDVVGMPNSTYGIANGRILLRNTTATTPGTHYGSGAVGTGTTLLGVGTGENAISVNGKSPYAGPWLWGNRQSNIKLTPFLRDSTRREQ